MLKNKNLKRSTTSPLVMIERSSKVKAFVKIQDPAEKLALKLEEEKRLAAEKEK